MIELALSDIRQAIAYVKEPTGVKKVFLTGHSTGARYVYLYACARWAEDLKGMIPMDGSPRESAGPRLKGRWTSARAIRRLRPVTRP